MVAEVVVHLPAGPVLGGHVIEVVACLEIPPDFLVFGKGRRFLDRRVCSMLPLVTHPRGCVLLDIGPRYGIVDIDRSDRRVIIKGLCGQGGTDAPFLQLQWEVGKEIKDPGLFPEMLPEGLVIDEDVDEVPDARQPVGIGIRPQRVLPALVAEPERDIIRD